MNEMTLDLPGHAVHWKAKLHRTDKESAINRQAWWERGREVLSCPPYHQKKFLYFSQKGKKRKKWGKIDSGGGGGKKKESIICAPLSLSPPPFLNNYVAHERGSPHPLTGCLISRSRKRREHFVSNIQTGRYWSRAASILQQNALRACRPENNAPPSFFLVIIAANFFIIILFQRKISDYISYKAKIISPHSSL